MEKRQNPQSGKSESNLKKTAIRTHYSPGPQFPGEKPVGKSLTVPDMNLSIKEILLNHSRGLESPVRMYGENYLETEIPTITDLTDIQAYKEQLYEKEQELKNQLDMFDKQKNDAIIKQQSADKEKEVFKKPVSDSQTEGK